VNRTRVPWNAIANGQFILVRRSSYEAVGTHEAVKHSVADDVSLAQAYVRHGFDIFLVHAAHDMQRGCMARCVKSSAGWSKNLALGAPPHGAAGALDPCPASLPHVMPALLWLGPPIAWAAFGWDFAAIATLGVAAHVDRDLRRGARPGSLRAAVSARGRDGGVNHDPLGVAWRPQGSSGAAASTGARRTASPKNEIAVLTPSTQV